MKKSKFVLLSLILIVFLGFSLFFVPAKVNGASDDELDIEDYWVALGFPLSAMNYYDVDGKGIRFYVEQVNEVIYEGTLYRFVMASPVQGYNFDDGSIDTNTLYSIPNQLQSETLVSALNYYYDTYEILSDIPEWDRMVIHWDVDQQRFSGPDFLIHWINRSDELEDQVEESYNEGYNLGYNNGRNEGYDEGYQTGYNEGYDLGCDVGYDLGYNEGHDVGYSEGYDEGYNVGFEIAQPKMDILLITLIMFILSVFVYFKFRIKWVLIATILLWFVPIFLVENLFIKIFSAIMIVATIVITFFNDREEEF